MIVEHSPGYLARASEAYFGALAKKAPEVTAECLCTVRELELLMPVAWDGLRSLMCLDVEAPSRGERRTAYELLRGAFSALHGSCVTEAQDIMFTAVRGPTLEARTGVIAEALREASETLGSGSGESDRHASSPSIEILRTSLWIDPFAFDKAISGHGKTMRVPDMWAPGERWAAFARSTLDGKAPLPQGRAGACDQAPELERSGAGAEGSGLGMAPRAALASAVDRLRQAAVPEPVAHIVPRCIARHAAYEATFPGDR